MKCFSLFLFSGENYPLEPISNFYSSPDNFARLALYHVIFSLVLITVPYN